MFIDNENLIVQSDGDTGDTLRVEGSYQLAIRLRARSKIEVDSWPKASHLDYMESIAKMQIEPGIFVRHPHPNQEWHKDPSETSRDQMTPNICAMGYAQCEASLKEFTKQMRKRWFVKFQNKDIASPQDWGSMIRSWWEIDGLGYFTYAKVALLSIPILALGDSQMIFSVLVRLWQARDPDNVGDDWNLLALILQAQHTMPTPMSWLARKLYKWFRPSNLGKSLIHSGHPLEPHLAVSMPIYDALRWYTRPGSGGNPEVAWVYAPLIQRM